jgi:hypothetical protein
VLTQKHLGLSDRVDTVTGSRGPPKVNVQWIGCTRAVHHCLERIQWESKANVSRGRERHMHVSNTGGCPPKKWQSWSGKMMVNRWLYGDPILRPACTWVWSRDRMEAQRTSTSFIIPNRECGCNRLVFGKSLIEIKWILGQNLQETTMLTWNIGVSCFNVPSGPFNTHGWNHQDQIPTCMPQKAFGPGSGDEIKHYQPAISKAIVFDSQVPI